MAAAVGKFFKLESRKTNLITELRGGTVTFLTVGSVYEHKLRVLGELGLVIKEGWGSGMIERWCWV